MSKYGGFTSVSTAYFFLVEHDKGKKRIRTIETVPIYLADRIDKNENALYNYCVEQLGLVNPSIRVKKIKLHSLVKYNGYYAHMTGITGNRIYLRNAVSMVLGAKWVKYIKKIEKYNETSIKDELLSNECNVELYNNICKKHKTTIFNNKPNPSGKMLLNGIEKFKNLNLDSQLKVLFQVLNLSVIGFPKADLTLIGGASNSGVILLGKNLEKVSEIKLINQSVTGLYESKPIDLLTV